MRATRATAAGVRGSREIVAIARQARGSVILRVRKRQGGVPVRLFGNIVRVMVYVIRR